MRFPHLTLIKTVSLLLVIFAHGLLPFVFRNPFWQVYADTPSPSADFAARIMGVTLIPSFIFASGFLLENTVSQRDPDFVSLLLSRAKRLLLPWFAVMLFWLVPVYVVFDIPVFLRPAETPFIQTLALGLQGKFVDHLWFLLALFWASLFWMFSRPLLRRLPSWASLVYALIAALCVECFGKGLTWYCLWETGAPILYLFSGAYAFQHREKLDVVFLSRPIRAALCILVPMAILLPFAHKAFIISWTLGVLGILLFYLLGLVASKTIYPYLERCPIYAYFERNSFRYYLFHMPTPIVLFTALASMPRLPAWPAIFLLFFLTLAVTTVLVRASHALEAMLPQILARMRSYD